MRSIPPDFTRSRTSSGAFAAAEPKSFSSACTPRPWSRSTAPAWSSCWVRTISSAPSTRRSIALARSIGAAEANAWMGLQQLIIRYGLAAVFLGSGLEGDITMVLGGVVSHRGYFPASIAIAAAAMGAFAADCIWYAVGRLNTVRLQNAAFYRKVGPRIEEIVRRVGVWQIVMARFVYGTKNA